MMCPHCGNPASRQSVQAYRTSWSCPECGHVWKDLTYPYACESATLTDIMEDEIRQTLDENLEIYHVRSEEVNRRREREKELTVKWIINGLITGPLQGGTMARGPDFVQTFGTSVTKAVMKCVLIRDRTCPVCGIRPSQEAHHIRPKFLRGSDHPRNFIGLCFVCHDEVHRKIDDEIQRALQQSLDIPAICRSNSCSQLERWCSDDD